MIREGFDDYRAASSAPDAPDADLQRLVERIVREELQNLVAGAERLDRAPTQPDVFALMQWLAPFIRETIVDAIRIGLSIHGTGSAQSASGDSADGNAAGALPPVADFAAALAAVRAREQQPAAAERRDGTADSQLGGPAVIEDGGDAATPALLSGHVTVLVSPFEGFADVQHFLHDLARLPKVFDVKPKRFTGGRLYVTFGTEYGDTQALADVILTELAPYRPMLRSVQSDFLELLLRPQE